MFRRRQQKQHHPINTKPRAMRTQRRPPIEPLEQRMMLTTITGTGVLEYKDGSNAIVRVAYSGVTAELVFGRVIAGGTPQRVVLGEPVSPGDQSEDGHDLYHIFIQKASIDSYISIARVPAITVQVRPMQPFGGSVNIRVTSQRNGQLTAVTLPGGDVLLGAKQIQLKQGNNPDIPDQPILQARFNGLGIMPATKNGKLVPGLSMAPGADLGRFLLGGTIMGAVYVPLGSIDTFYAGNIITGNANGQLLGDPDIPDNFFVNGELRNLLVLNNIGTDDPNNGNPHLTAGTVIHITGRSDEIKTGGSNISYTRVDNRTDVPRIRAIQKEIETKDVPSGSFTSFEQGILGDANDFFENDALNTAGAGQGPQFLGTFDSRRLGNNVIQVQGEIDNTFATATPPNPEINDTYGVGLLAGQTITIRLISDGFLHIGVIDPDNNLVASDYDNNLIRLPFDPQNTPTDQDIAGALTNLPWQFTPSKPGNYKFVIGRSGGADFNLGFPRGFFAPYQLQILNIGDVGLGGLAVGDQLFNATNTGGALVPPPNPSVLITEGNLGCIEVGGSMYYSPASIKPDILVNRGDLGGVQAAQLGLNDGTRTAFGLGPNITVKGGSIGLLRGDGDLTTHLNFVEAKQINGNGKGGDIQTVSSPNGNTFFDLHADRRIGSIAVNDMATALNVGASRIEVNADRRRNDGVLDLLSVTGDLGTLGAGGPQITTNNGNVRYIHVGGTIFRDQFFGGSLPQETFFLQGQEAFLTDDSGAQITLTPTQSVLLDASGNPVNDANGLPIDTSGTLAVTTYPIRRTRNVGIGGGGSAIVRVQTDRGVSVLATTAGQSGTAEIGEIIVNGLGKGLITDPGPDGVPNTGDEDPGPDGIPNTGDELLIPNPNTQNDNAVLIHNNSSKKSKGPGTRVDVFSVTGTDLDSVRNTSRGEIVNVNATTIGRLEAGSIGVARRNTGAELYAMPIASPRATVFPFVNQRTGIVTTGNVAEMLAYQGIGNVMAGGIIQRLVANSDGKFEKGVFEGIAAPVYAQDNLQFVDIGEGILPSGTGAGSLAGLYCHNRINRVVNQGLGSDIRGDIIAWDSIGPIDLTDGAIINADIMVKNDNDTAEDGSDFISSREVPFGGVINSTPLDPTIGKIDAINVKGRGGIIGARIDASNLGRFNISGGFGIFSTFLQVLGDGRIEQTTTSGYGVRNSFWQGGAFVDGVSATGNGKALPTSLYTPSVRLSEGAKFDPYFGIQPSIQTDINTYLGTSGNKPTRIGHTDSGAIENSRWITSRDLGTMTANAIRGTLLNFGNQISTVSSRTSISDLSVTAGRFDNLLAGSDILKSEIGVAGPIGLVRTGGSLRGSSALLATGPDGTIANIETGTSLFGNVESEIGIGKITVGTDVGSPNVHSGGDFDQIIVDGHLLNGSSITAVKDINQLVVGGDIKEDAFVQARDIKKKLVKGEQLGSVVETINSGG